MASPDAESLFSSIRPLCWFMRSAAVCLTNRMNSDLLDLPVLRHCSCTVNDSLHGCRPVQEMQITCFNRLSQALSWYVSLGLEISYPFSVPDCNLADDFKSFIYLKEWFVFRRAIISAWNPIHDLFSHSSLYVRKHRKTSNAVLWLLSMSFWVILTKS